ncbi:hypothetical protein MKY29_14205 [Psychrobacillus sp. FSL K6-2365]|uniref:hypothetical protein n=1 Tax=Psychrobacillus sp. FSL K6-2365 TaxID=2921546 RepID=UPI0030FC8D80
MTIPAGYLVYHPKRECQNFNNTVVHFDKPKHNQDPYIWNKQFLHSTCHITQMRTGVGQIIFWVSGDTFPHFTNLYCDLVFVVKDKFFWEDKNKIELNDKLVDSENAYKDHYYHVPIDHPYKRRRRYTLKADELTSFQPQSRKSGELVDLLPILIGQGYSLNHLHSSFKAGRGSKPIPLEDKSIVLEIYNTIEKQSNNKLFGKHLEQIRIQNPQLQSPL